MNKLRIELVVIIIRVKVLNYSIPISNHTFLSQELTFVNFDDMCQLFLGKLFIAILHIHFDVLKPVHIVHI